MINGDVFQHSVIIKNVVALRLSMPEILGYIYHYAKDGVSTTTPFALLHLKMSSIVGYLVLEIQYMAIFSL